MSDNDVTLLMTAQEAGAVEDALAYYDLASRDNFAMGYEGAEGREERKAHKRARRVLDRLIKARGDDR